MIRYIIALGFILSLMASCSQDDNEYTDSLNSGTDTDAVPVAFQLSLDQSMETETGYLPMKSEPVDAGYKTVISNFYKVYIIKEVGTKWIIEKIIDQKIDPDDTYNIKNHGITSSAPFHSFNTDLRPGKYRMTIYTGAKNMTFNDELKLGAIVEDSSNPTLETPWACTYKYISGGYIHPGWRHIQEEIFTNTIPFTIAKTEDVHSAPKPNTFPVSLHRMVSKLRILLHYEKKPINQHQFETTEPNAIGADLKTLDGKVFCMGLDIWGQPFYKNPFNGTNGGEYITNMKYAVSCWQRPEAPAIIGADGNEYIMGMKTTRQFSAFYFSDPAQETPVSLSEIEVSASSTFPLRYVYAHPNTGYMEAPIDITLKHNSIHGVIFSCGDDSWPGNQGLTYVNMLLRTETNGDPVDSRSIFDDYFENRLSKTP